MTTLRGMSIMTSPMEPGRQDRPSRFSDHSGGDPAFAQQPCMLPDGEPHLVPIGMMGMTKREYIAVAASDKDVSAFMDWIPDENLIRTKDSRVKARYLYADAMIQEGGRHD